MGWKTMARTDARVASAVVRALLVGLSLCLAQGVCASPEAAAGLSRPAYPERRGDFIVHDFRLVGGAVLPVVKLHYVTFGDPSRDPAGHVTNAVLMLHGTTGSSAQFLSDHIRQTLFAPGQPLDATKHFIILPDDLGRGGSSKPSDGLRTRFPQYGYADIVDAQYRLVTDGLKVDHLKLILGTSMGGMQTWMWGESHPDMADGLMPIASQPVAMAGRNWLWRQMIIGAIEADPGWKGGDYEQQPRQWLLATPVFALMTGDPARLQASAPNAAAAKTLYETTMARFATFDANDVLYWFRSSLDYDPEPALGRIKAKLYAVNFADDLVNAIELHIMQKLVPKIPGARYVEIPDGPKSNGHQTLGEPEVWKPYLIDLLASLPSTTSLKAP